MKFNRRLLIDGNEVDLVADAWVLEKGFPGRAILAIQSPEPVSGVVSYAIGWDGQVEQWFTGYVEGSVQMDRKQQRVRVRELTGLLEARCPLSLRNALPRDVIGALAEQTGIEFVANLPETRLSHVVNLGTGLAAVNRLGTALRVDGFVCQGMPGGRAYVGSVTGLSPLTVTLPAAVFTDLTVTGGGMAALPRVRPGTRLQIGNGSPVTVTRVELRDSTMRFGWQ